jgi:Rieske Fe-S protein
MAFIPRRIFAPGRAEVEALPPGHGGVVERDGKKVGVYRDEAGNDYVVSIRCPHLGCQLEWNPNEKSWDCPCHGSRFDYKGNLIDNPAQEDLCHD